MSWFIYLLLEFFWSIHHPWVWVAFTTILAYYLALRSLHWFKLNRSLPPGPYGLPLVGYLPFLKRPDDIRSELTDLSLKYGPCFSIRLGTELMIILSDHRLIKEAFCCPVFNGRPKNEFFNIIKGYGIVNAEGTLWKEQRKFIRRNLPQIGNGESSRGLQESRIMMEIEEMLGNISEKKSEPIVVNSYFIPAVSNVICSLVMSVRFRKDEPRFLQLIGNIEEGFRLFTVVGAAAFMPFLRFLPHFSRGFRSLKHNFNEMLQFSRQPLYKCKNLFNRMELYLKYFCDTSHGDSEALNINLMTFFDFLDRASEACARSFTTRFFTSHNCCLAKDLVNAYIKESRAMKNGSGGRLFAGMDPDRQIQQIIADLFSTGTETVQTTLRWATIFALREPELQLRVQKEIDTVVGRNRLPSLQDFQHLPFTEAFVLEVMRRTTAVPLGTPHVATKTTTLRGMTIPKGAQVIPLLHAVHMNPELWTEPERFNPERFLSEDGMSVVKPNCFIPFGVGRRSCIGDTLAMSQLLLFFSSLLHSFDIRLPEGVTDPPDLNGICGATFAPKSFQVCMVPRMYNKKIFQAK